MSKLPNGSQRRHIGYRDHSHIQSRELPANRDLKRSCAELPPTQIIVVDDGSKDNTREIVAEFASPVEYIAKENGGKSTALNFGLQHAREKLIWIFDYDDLAEPDALRNLVSAERHRVASFFQTLVTQAKMQVLRSQQRVLCGLCTRSIRSAASNSLV